MVEHTATPWEYRDYPDLFEGRACGVIQCVEGVRDTGRVIAFIRSGPNMPIAEVKPNAAFIVRAVNCHEKLVAALEQAEIAMNELKKRYAEGEGGWFLIDAIQAAEDETHWVAQVARVEVMVAAALAKAKESTAHEPRLQQQDLDEETL